MAASWALLPSEIRPQPGLIRDYEKIPSSLWNFFQWDPLEEHPLPQEKALLYCQVYCHEVEELLFRWPKYVLPLGLSLDDLLLRYHPFDLLLHLRKEVFNFPQAPQKSPFEHKARYNQWVQLKLKLNNTHPCVAFSEPGLGYKEGNEDGILVHSPLNLIAISDGMGGLSRGDAASAVVVDFLEKALNEGESPEQAAFKAQEALLARSRLEQFLGGDGQLGCTLVMAQIFHGQVKIWHMGDSKALLIRQGKILLETQDHSKGQELFNKRLISEKIARQLNHVLSRGLGDPEMNLGKYLEESQAPLQAGDRLLLATDGITDNYFGQGFELSALAKAASHPQLEKAVHQIKEACLQKMRSGVGKPDNLSLALLEYGG